MRIGLANLPLMLAPDLFSLPAFALLVVIKVLGQALITGTLFSYVFLFSLAGTTVSAAAMYLLRRRIGPDRIGFVGVGVTGAFLSNAAQLALARFFIFGGGALLLAPPFLAAGIITGAALGLFCETFAGRSAWYRGQMKNPAASSGVSSLDRKFIILAGAIPRSEDTKTHVPYRNITRGKPRGMDPGLPMKKNGASPGPPRGEPRISGPATKGRDLSRLRRRERYLRFFRSGDLCIAGLVMMGAFLFNPSPVLRVPQFLLFWFYAWFAGKKNNPLATILAILVIVLVNLLVPYGRVLAEFGSLRITQGSLLGGLRRAVTLEGLIMLSRASVRPDLRLPGPLGSLIGESLRIFERIAERSGGITRGRFIEGIDALLMELSAEEDPGRGTGDRPAEPERTLPGMLLLTAAVLLIAVFTILPGIKPDF
jgi:heptaprenyl diphosphate synthase